ncbi:hypothetical protein CRM22_006001 [Opisthorchis felineus]|uniref:LIM zinc-binding domain-containing protein n=1 Tax=Opisthorchis felineus TaxID=147828 RepID=A0A4S2LN83_OPIFE|nr:hypothetical protein CRM22_006001 [Opisthorchis felineus]
MILCDCCRRVLSVGDTVLETLGRYFHFNCLKCVCCSKPIATDPFLPIAGLFPVCKDCWLTKSHRLIEGLINTPEDIGRWRRQGQVNEFWIQSHRNMAGLSTQCRQHSSECYVCRNPIIVGCPYVYLDERPIHAHCLICSVCGVRLTDKEFVAHHVTLPQRPSPPTLIY